MQERVRFSFEPGKRQRSHPTKALATRGLLRGRVERNFFLVEQVNKSCRLGLALRSKRCIKTLRSKRCKTLFALMVRPYFKFV